MPKKRKIRRRSAYRFVTNRERAVLEYLKGKLIDAMPDREARIAYLESLIVDLDKLILEGGK